jgi:hypothetical protein
MLDAEALAMVNRASPFPRPPVDANFENGKLKMVLPINFATDPTALPSSGMVEDAVLGKEDAALNQKLHSICAAADASNTPVLFSGHATETARSFERAAT